MLLYISSDLCCVTPHAPNVLAVLGVVYIFFFLRFCFLSRVDYFDTTLYPIFLFIVVRSLISHVKIGLLFFSVYHFQVGIFATPYVFCYWNSQGGLSSPPECVKLVLLFRNSCVEIDPARVTRHFAAHLDPHACMAHLSLQCVSVLSPLCYAFLYFLLSTVNFD